jgi:hypothetical protein
MKQLSLNRREWLATAAVVGTASLAPAAEGNPRLQGATVIPLLPPRPGNPRNTEGAFVTLRDGRILFAYTKFTGGDDDHAAAIIAGRFSADGGRTWSAEDITIVEREGTMNVMSVSLLRLRDGRIALFYLRKNSVFDCKPFLRYSSDEAQSWSESVQCVSDDGYWVLNNDRVVELPNGRLVMPLALHERLGDDYNPRGKAMTYFSDDAGRRWRRSRNILECPTDSRMGFQEPGVVRLSDLRLMMFIRTRLGRQYLSYSSDDGESWSAPEPSSLQSPLSPASVKRIPSTGDLLVAWNDHAAVPPEVLAVDAAQGGRGGKRTPFTLAVSKDEGRTWIHKQNLLDHPDGWYCYTAIHFVDDVVLLGFVSGGAGLAGLSKTDIARVPIPSLYPG